MRMSLVESAPVLVVCIVILALLQYVTLCTGVCEDCFATHLPNFDDLRILDYNLWNRKCPNVGVCFRLCYSDSLCVSYQYNEDTQRCYGYRSSFMELSIVNTDIETGNKLYNTCKGLNHFGAACSVSTDCHDYYNDCIDGSCGCQMGYKYSNVTGGCFKYYIGCYDDDEFHTTLPYNDMYSPVMTIQLCVDHCRSYGHRFAGLQYGEECFCGNWTGTGYTQLADTDCSMSCAGDHSQKCGNGFVNSVYATRP